MDKELVQRLLCKEKWKKYRKQYWKVQAKYDKAVEKSNKSNRAQTDCLMWIASGFIKAQTELQRKSSGSGDRQQQEALIDGRGVREPSPLLEIL